MNKQTALIKLAQERLGALGFDPGPVDGILGKQTDTALASYIITRPAIVVSFENTLIALAQIEVAKNIRETSKNQGAEIEKYWTATSYPKGFVNREPYCAAFLCWLVKVAFQSKVISFTLPTSPVAYDFEKWAKSNSKKGVGVFSEPKAGDIFTLATASHCGLVESVRGDSVVTIEANTNEAGSREGDGVYRKTRKISTVSQFIRIAY